MNIYEHILKLQREVKNLKKQLCCAQQGGEGLRFGFTGEDAVAGENRRFELGGLHNFEVGNVGAFGIAITVDGANNYLQVIGNLGLHLLVDIINGDYVLGDRDGTQNGTHLRIDDANQDAAITSVSGLLFRVTGGANFYGQLGNNALGNGTNMFIDDSTQMLGVAVSTGFMLFLDRVNGLYRIGDVDGTANNTKHEIDDTTQIQTFTSTLGKYAFTNVQEFADNAAALVGGLTVGMIYRTGDALKIVH